MLQPVTRRITDLSTPAEYRFVFHCDICGASWESDPVKSITPEPNLDTRARDHEAAYERANLEAMRQFNRCPICKRFVCNECFLELPVRDVCMVCAKQVEEESVEA